MIDEEAIKAAARAMHAADCGCEDFCDVDDDEYYLLLARAAVRAVWDLAVAHGQERAEAALAATERTLDRMVSEAASDSVRLCVGTHHPIDPGNYPGPIHCLGHPQGHPCVTAMYGRTPDTTFTADERMTRGGTS